ncbi:MAG: hypothetical protein QOE62_2155 [Actinomycetota bacterium]|nr:hypothetical protein [Actinomycetota bacterium]
MLYPLSYEGIRAPTCALACRQRTYSLTVAS